MNCAKCLLGTLSLVLFHSMAHISQPSASAADADRLELAEELPRIPPQSPAEAIKSFRVAKGFRIELVAAEPLVTDPVAMDFDENGRLFVVEMRGYSEQGDEGLGRIRLLEDHDGDGRYDAGTTYVDGLFWPTAVLCYDGGVFVGAAPDILYFKDTNGDGRSDVRRVALTGFGRGNVQGLLNSFRWDLDNRIHGATSSAGARVIRGQRPAVRREQDITDDRQLTADHPAVRNSGHPAGTAIVLRGRDFAFDPRTLDLEATTGGGQHGMTFSPWGDKFVCSNSDHIQQVMYEDRYAARNPFVVPPPPRQSIAVDGPQADVFRISPVEPWRVVRTRLRVAGVVPGPVEGGGTPAGYFTSATGLTIYDGHAWPEEYHGLAIVGDVGGNLIHRKRLAANGIRYSAHRIDQENEFVASSDIWFRPVQFAVGPDGALYVADMYREVIEHPDSLPPAIKEHLDLTSGRDRGRIYRIVPDEFEQPPAATLSESTTAELVGLLGHANGWHRRTAARLLFERGDAEAIGPLMQLALSGDSPLPRMHALYVLDGLGALEATTLSKALDDDSPAVRRHAVRLAERLEFQDGRLEQQLLEKVSDPSPYVRYQLAFTLGEVESNPARNAALADLLARHIDDEYMRFAVFSSLKKGAADVAGRLRQHTKFASTPVGTHVLEMLAEQIERQQKATMDGHEVAGAEPEPIEMIKNDNPERQSAFHEYRRALSIEGDANRGQAIFQKRCAGCHQLEGNGTPLGPNLAAAAHRGSEALLLAIIDPNREVDPRFTQYLVTTAAGRTYAGAIAGETATSITLQDGENEPRTILKVDVEEITNTQRSLMPERLEQEISVEQMADLLAYLQRVD